MEFGKLLTFGAIGVGAYYLYTWWAGQSVTASATPASTTPTVAQYMAAGLTQAQAQGAQYLGLTVAQAVAAYAPAPVATSGAIPATVAATTPVPSSVSALDAYYAALEQAVAPDTFFTGSWRFESPRPVKDVYGATACLSAA